MTSITVQDAKSLNNIYERFGQVFTANDGQVEHQGTECLICNGAHERRDMIYCLCEKGLVCEKCCNHCGFRVDGECTWK